MANLLDRSSLVLTPTAYNNGEALCIKPDDGSGDFDFSRNSAATRVNAQGLVENVQILSSNLVQNGDFSEEGAEEVSNGSFSQEGVELVTNGSFDSDSGWNKQTSNWTISNGYAVCDGLQTTNSSLFQDLAVVNGNSYRIDFTITDSANDLNLILGATTIGQYGAGTHSIYITKDANASARIFFQATASNGFQGSIDNVSVREVGQDWTFTSGATLTDIGAKITHTPTAGSIAQLSVLTIGKQYKLTYEITSGGLKFNSAVDASMVTTVGVHTKYFEADGTTAVIGRTSATDNDVTITNISVKEVGQNWDLGTGWSIGNNVAISDTTASNLTPSTVLISGEKYKFTLDVAKISVGSFTFLLRFNGTNTTFATINTEGSFTFYATADATGFRLQNLSGGTTDFSVTNITAVQITDDTNLPRINYEGFSYQDALGSEEIVNGGFDTNLNNWVAYSNTLISWESGGYALLDSNNNFWCKIKQSNVFEIGKTYKVILTAKSDRTDLSFHNSPITGSFSEPDTFETFEQYYTATTTDFLFGYANAGSATITIDNVSVKEVTAQEVVPDSGCGSWLFEPQSTNTVNNSNPTNALEYSSNITKTNNTAISPDSTFNAMSFTPTATQGIHRAGYSLTAGSYSQNDIVTFSCFVKANGYNFVTVGGFFGQEKAVFNISNGTLVSQESNVINTKIVKLTNDWYRLSTTYTFQNSINNGYLYAGIYVMDTETGYAFTGDGVSGVYGYGFQAELGTGTSYIPTEGSTVTRNQDVCTNGGSLASINSTEGVLYLEASRLSDLGTCQIGLFGSSSNEQIRIEFNNSSIRAQLYNGSYQVNMTSSQTVTNNNKIAFKYKENDFALWINGVEVLTDNSGVTFNADELIKFNLSNGTGALPFFGKTKAVALFPYLSDSELQSLTTI